MKQPRVAVHQKTHRPRKHSELSRKKIPRESLLIGSFQKDGIGWGEGNEPKLIKGPDIFINSLEKIKKCCDPFVILTGPSRGFVKKGLKNFGPFGSKIT